MRKRGIKGVELWAEEVAVGMQRREKTVLTRGNDIFHSLANPGKYTLVIFNHTHYLFLYLATAERTLTAC